MTNVAPALGVLAGVLAVIDAIPYVRDTLRRATTPHRGTWLIWAVLAIVACASQSADGASWSLLMLATQAVVTTLVFVLAIRLGTGGLSRADLMLLAIAGTGVAGWLLAAAPVVATACIVVADLVAAAMMVPKTWRDPASETLSTFVCASLGGALASASVGALDPSLLVYPLYFCAVNLGLALLIAQRRATLRDNHAQRRSVAH
ncbi:hypothetical protein [Solirubrobacter soli]|uniref:hypothetical protein n=1 Tax=Solirubrobacter soli TaxID=363832 RepID=UPI00040A2B32|nr:hypothetical protein [Solirubrobacter soli]